MHYLETVNKELKEGNMKVNAMREMISQSTNTKRGISDNLRHRENERAIKQMQRKLVEMEQNINDTVGSANIDEDIQNVEIEYERISKEHYILIGKKQNIEQQITRDEAELKKPAYKNIDEEHRGALIKVTTTEMVCADLQKYFSALDKALMSFHTLKMEEINKVIKELWQATYKGNDIDTIEIRSDMTIEDKVKQKKSYNYRVVMLKGDVDLDMRGRCSAGQKVLASLIIRLALAESFCINCGILALDEPTTNLDRNNVESFAAALVNIIESRRQQRSFQLIIITHDEEFVQLLGRSEHADYYWRVSKDHNGHSTIERQDIRDLS